MPHGKPAHTRCVQLTRDNRCSLFGDPRRPAVCARLQASADMCGANERQALQRLALLERLTAPQPG